MNRDFVEMEIAIGDLNVGTIGRADFIKNKRASGRPKDLLDLELASVARRDLPAGPREPTARAAGKRSLDCPRTRRAASSAGVGRTRTHWTDGRG